MNIAGTKLAGLMTNTYHNDNSQVNKVNKTLQTAAGNYSNRVVSTNSARTQTGFQVLSGAGKIDNMTAASIIETADEGLSETESILRRMSELANAFNDPTKILSHDDKEKINEELEKLLEELNQISDNNLMLDGCFGGIQGKDGILDMGIDAITSTGDFNGKIKFNIEVTENGVNITARTGDKSVTNKLKFSDKETVFDFGNSKVSLKFNDGARNLKAGSIKNVSFSIGSHEADVTRAISKDKKSTSISTINKNGKEIMIPDLWDVSAAGLGLNGIKLNNVMDAKHVLAKLNETLTRIGHTRTHLSEARTAINGFYSKG